MIFFIFLERIINIKQKEEPEQLYSFNAFNNDSGIFEKLRINSNKTEDFDLDVLNNLIFNDIKELKESFSNLID